MKKITLTSEQVANAVFRYLTATKLVTEQDCPTEKAKVGYDFQEDGGMVFYVEKYDDAPECKTQTEGRTGSST